ncbi:MAG: patatin-like phospholipase family protein [Vicinamibacterales bacterium]
MSEPGYSPRLRTALVLTGAGTSGAYHAGVLKALGEAGVKVDLVAGHGMGAVSAAFAAVDGATKLHDAHGLWRHPALSRAYTWRTGLKIAGGALLIAAALILSPLLLLGVTLAVYLVSLVLSLASMTDAAAATTRAYHAMLDAAIAPEALPTVMPRAVVLVLLVTVIALVGAWGVARRSARARRRGAFWQRVVGAPLSSGRLLDVVTLQLWELVRGLVTAPRPAMPEFGRRYVELLTENLGQPGFRELLLTAHDVEARRDISISLLSEPHRTAFHERRSDGQPREGETIDLTGIQRDAIVTALEAALSVPLVTEPARLAYPADSYWRGETHRVVDRPGCLLHLVDEAAAAGAEQAIIVSAAPPPAGPHQLRTINAGIAAQSGEVLRGIETASLAEAERVARARFASCFVIRPPYNPIGPFDFGGTDDEASDRRMTLAELMERGYQDAYHQFIEPVVAVSGEKLGTGLNYFPSEDVPVSEPR